MDKIDQEDGAEEQGFGFEIELRLVGDAEIVGVGECFFEQAAPFFGNFAQFVTIFSDLEGPGVEYGTEKVKNRLVIFIGNYVFAAQDGKLPFNGAKQGSLGVKHFELVEIEPERSLQAESELLVEADDLDLEGSPGSE